MKFARVVFLIAGLYGLVVLTPGYFFEQAIGRETPPPITHPEFFMVFWAWLWPGRFCFY